MTNYNTIIFISKLIRSLLKDGLRTNNNCPAVFVYEGDNTFTLPDDYVSSSTIVVKKNGVVLSAGWAYNSSTNEISISIALTVGDIITVTYSFYDKYSDTELKNYIEGALAYFAQYANKLFVLSNDELTIEAYEGNDPGLTDSYQIAIITAIVIDPQNITIRTKEFTVEPAESKSKSDLILDAFRQFSFSASYLGVFSFDEALCKDDCTC